MVYFQLDLFSRSIVCELVVVFGFVDIFVGGKEYPRSAATEHVDVGTGGDLDIGYFEFALDGEVVLEGEVGSHGFLEVLGVSSLALNCNTLGY